MGPLRGARLRRSLTLLLLLLAVADLGVHGIFASDFAPVASAGAPVRLTAGNHGTGGHLTSDHCFCHSVSIGAVVPASPALLTHLGGIVLALPLPLPCAKPGGLDKPPQLTA